jgi:mRNA interferase YafQ
MYSIRYTGKFKKDFKVVEKRKYNLLLLKATIATLANGEELPQNQEAHKLGGNYSDCWECHIKPDWLLIWRYEPDFNELWLMRTGTHSDLF